MTGQTIDFFNLSRGLLCQHHQDHTNPHYTRIQSTQLEQKLFSEVLETAGPDLLFHLATGSQILVHDVSEKPRRTRALWQGLPFIRYACERIWGLNTPGCHYREATVPRMRNGHNVTAYFEEILRTEIPGSVVRSIRYFQQYWNGHRLFYDICAGPSVVASTNDLWSPTTELQGEVDDDNIYNSLIGNA